MLALSTLRRSAWIKVTACPCWFAPH